MLILLLNKILYVLFFVSVLNIIRRGYFLIQSFITDEKYKLNNMDLILLGISLAFSIACIFTGITI
jgi:hypothetical protein